MRVCVRVLGVHVLFGLDGQVKHVREASLACRLSKAAAWRNKLDMNCLYECVGFLPARFGLHLLLG